MITDNNVVEGMLEMAPKGHGFIREMNSNLTIKPKDPLVSSRMIQRYNLREGLIVKASTEKKKGGSNNVAELISLNGCSVDDYTEIDSFDDFTVIAPDEILRMETGPDRKSVV